MRPKPVGSLVVVVLIALVITDGWLWIPQWITQWWRPSLVLASVECCLPTFPSPCDLGVSTQQPALLRIDLLGWAPNTQVAFDRRVFIANKTESQSVEFIPQWIEPNRKTTVVHATVDCTLAGANKLTCSLGRVVPYRLSLQLWTDGCLSVIHATNIYRSGWVVESEWSAS